MLLHIIRAAVAQRCRAAAADAEADASFSNRAAANGAVPGDARPAPGNAAEPDALQRLHLPGRSCSNAAGGCGGMHTFVFERDDDFHEIRDFVAGMDRQYGLNVEVWMLNDDVQQAGFHQTFTQRTGLHAVCHLFQVLTGDFKAGLTQLVNSGGVRAIILGTRRSALTSHSRDIDAPTDARCDMLGCSSFVEAMFNLTQAAFLPVLTFLQQQVFCGDAGAPPMRRARSFSAHPASAGRPSCV